MHNTFDLPIAKEESERVDTLRYTWEKVLGQATEYQHLLGEIQPNFRGSLISNIAQFQVDCKTFFSDYAEVCIECLRRVVANGWFGACHQFVVKNTILYL